MNGKHMVRGAMVVLLLTATAAAQSTAESYLEAGRASLFDGTLSGIRQAAAIFEDALADPDCADCPEHRELLFFHAVTRVAMWVVKDDPDSVQSAIELARAVGIDIQGDRIDEIVIPEPDIPEDRYGRPILPDDLEGLLIELGQFRDAAMLPEVASVINQLDAITETPDDPFVVWLTPEELQVFLSPEVPPFTEAIKVDYGDVLMLKGTLSMVRFVMGAHAAYDLHVSDEAMLLEKTFEDMFSIQHDLLLPHPELFKLLPTGNDPRDGTGILAEARQDVIRGLEAYIEAMTFLLDESRSADPGQLDNELFFVVPEDYFFIEQTRERLAAGLDSLLDDTDFMFVGQHYKVFDLPYDQGTLSMEFTYDAFGLFNHGDGFLRVEDDDFYFHFYDVVFEVIEGRLYGYADHGWDWGAGWVSGFFSGDLNEDFTAISEGRFEYWGDRQGVIEGLAGSVAYQDTEQMRVDLNPIFGGSGRYPDPVSPRDLLSEFGDWNKPVPGTVGHGLGNDPTLGGIFPEMSHADWNRMIDAQPTGKLDWPLMRSWQISPSTGWPLTWQSGQRVFNDALGDVHWWVADRPGLDIDRLNMGLDLQYLYASIDLKDAPDSSGTYYYSVSLSPGPISEEIVGSLFFDIVVEDGSIYGDCFVVGGYQYWLPVEGLLVRLSGRSVMFKMPLGNLPVDISGRYLSVHSAWEDGYWGGIVEGDFNHTHLQIGSTESISGQVAFAGYLGGPIFVRAYTDMFNPNDSLVAYALLDGPGEFVLDDIGLGLEVYVEAFCPLFGSYHPLDMDALRVSTVQRVSLQSDPVSGVVLELDVPPVLQNDQWQQGNLFESYKRDDYYAFDAIAGAEYTFEFEPDPSVLAGITVLDRSGHRMLMSGSPWQSWPTYWVFPVNGRYYVRVSGLPGFGGAYQIRMRTDLDCPTADISGGQWVGVRDCRVDLHDFVLMASHWLQACTEPYWCQGSDLTQTGQVDAHDLSMLVEQWLAEGWE